MAQLVVPVVFSMLAVFPFGSAQFQIQVFNHQDWTKTFKTVKEVGSMAVNSCSDRRKQRHLESALEEALAKAQAAAEGAAAASDPGTLKKLQEDSQKAIQKAQECAENAVAGIKDYGTKNKMNEAVQLALDQTRSTAQFAFTAAQNTIATAGSYNANTPEQTSVVRDASNDGMKCGEYNKEHPDPNRVFTLRDGDATQAACIAACEDDTQCVAFSGVWGKWCIGCRVELDTAHGGTIAYKKPTSELATTVDWMVYEGLHCGGGKNERLLKWDDGTATGYKTANPDSIDGCKKVCAAHTECAGFVHMEGGGWNKEIEGAGWCSLWRGAPLRPQPADDMWPGSTEKNGRHTCYAKMSEKKQKVLCEEPSEASRTLKKMKALVKRIWQESQKLQLSKEKLKTQVGDQAKRLTQKEIKQHEADIAKWRQYGRKHGEDLKAHYTAKFVADNNWKQGQDEATSTADICVRRKLQSFARASQEL